MPTEIFYVGITDHNNQRFVVPVELTPQIRDTFDSHTSERDMSLQYIKRKIVRSEPIDCEIIHYNHNAKVTVIFLAAVRIDVAREG